MSRKIPRKEREKKRHSEEILRAAEAVFAEKGYNRARMSDIANTAEFSVGYMYNIWKSKKELYLSLLDSKIREFQTYIETRMKETDDPLEKIDILIEAHFNFLEKHQDFFKIYLSETSQADMRINSTVSKRFKRNRTHYLHLVEEVFEKGIERGIFIPISSHDLTIALKGLISAFTMDCLSRSQDAGFGARRDVMKRIFFDSVLKKPQETREELTGT